MDLSKVKPSKNFKDSTDRPLLRYLLSIYDPSMNYDEETGGHQDWSYGEKKRLKKGEDVLNLLRERMRNEYIRNFFMEGGNRSTRPFNFHREEFDTHSSIRKKSNGSAYDNY